MPAVRPNEPEVEVDEEGELPLGQQPNPRSFRLHATHVFLTYAQCPIPDHDTLLTLLRAKLLPTWKLVNHTIGRERHEDLGLHYHVVLSFSKRIDIKNATAFDVVYEGRTYHPNIKPIKHGKQNLARVVRYSTKDGDAISTHPTVPAVLEWGQCLVQATTKEEFLSLIAEHHPKEYINNLRNIEYCADRRFPPPPPLPYVPNPNYTFPNLPNSITEWVAGEFR